MESKAQMTIQQQKTYPFDIDYMPDEYSWKAQRELNETSENKSGLMQELKLMLEEESSTQGINFHEDFLCQFLRQSKYDVQKSLKRVLAFTRFRKNNCKYFKNVNADLLLMIPDYQYCTPLPWRCQDGCTMVIYEIRKYEPRNIPLDDFLRLGLILHHQSLRNPLSQINGFKVICDWKDSSLAHVKSMTPSTLHSVYQSFVECTPARYKEIHMVNGSLAMKVMWAIYKFFLSEKLRNRFLFHSSPKDLMNYFPKHALPAQYGGDLKNYYMRDWMKEANEQQRLSTIHGQSNYF